MAPTQSLFVYSRFYKQHYRKTKIDFTGIQTPIVREGIWRTR